MIEQPEKFKEKLEFANMNKQEHIKQEFQGKSIDEIFEQIKNINNITIDNNLMVIEEESFIKKILKRILNFFNKERLNYEDRYNNRYS